MKISPEELAMAKRALAKRGGVLPPCAPPPQYTKEEMALMKRYPRHTLQQAKEIDASQADDAGGGYTTGFERILWQERGRG